MKKRNHLVQITNLFVIFLFKDLLKINYINFTFAQRKIIKIDLSLL